MERQDQRPRLLQQQTGAKAQTAQHEYPISYWGDTQVGTSGLKNLGNTCYMNSTIQCLAATAPFATFFKDGTWQRQVNPYNPMGTKGRLAEAFARILREMSMSEMQTLTPIPFRVSCLPDFPPSSSTTHLVDYFSGRFANMPPSSKEPNNTTRKSFSSSSLTACMKT